MKCLGPQISNIKEKFKIEFEKIFQNFGIINLAFVALDTL